MDLLKTGFAMALVVVGACIGREGLCGSLSGHRSPAAQKAGATAFGLRAVQLDLARQIETVAFVKDYLRRSSEAGYNAVVLYLEDRLKTNSYQNSMDVDSYSVAEMKEIVAAAESLGIDLVPVVSPLGHTDRFFRHKELLPFAETYACSGRYDSTPKSVCLENPEARAWMERYLAEVMDVFSGKNFHMGFDETDDLGFCPRCRPLLRSVGLGRLFVRYVLWAYDIARRHGKRMWMWDDYFMYFPSELANVPRDVVMCAWNYCPDLETTGLRNCGGGRLRRDVMREYEKLGFECVMCPWYDVDNIVRMTDYAASRKCLGMLQTQWEMSGDFHGCYYPRTVASAALWQGNAPTFGDSWLAAGIRKTMPSLSDAGVNAAVTLLADQARMRLRAPSLASCLDGWTPVSAIAAWKGAVAELRSAASRPGAGDVPLGQLDEAGLLDDIVTRSEAVVILNEAANAARSLMDPLRTGAASRAAKLVIKGLVPRWRELCSRRLAQWRLWRQGEPRDLRSVADKFEEFVTDAMSVPDVAPEREWIVEVDIVMSDAYGVPKWQIYGRFDGRWRKLAGGMWKPRVGAPGYFAKRLPVCLYEIPDAIRVVYGGYGAGEICHVSLYNRSQRLVPVAVLSASDGVRDADNLLVDDLRMVRFGDPDFAAAILDPTLAEREFSAEYRLTCL